jgi:hypothetical protein
MALSQQQPPPHSMYLILNIDQINLSHLMFYDVAMRSPSAAMTTPWTTDPIPTRRSKNTPVPISNPIFTVDDKLRWNDDNKILTKRISYTCNDVTVSDVYMLINNTSFAELENYLLQKSNIRKTLCQSPVGSMFPTSQPTIIRIVGIWETTTSFGLLCTPFNPEKGERGACGERGAWGRK